MNTALLCILKLSFYYIVKRVDFEISNYINIIDDWNKPVPV